ncbi:type II toxin-antitoxin system MqsA family antitoxin [Marinobacter salexigens]|uniref:type II toxin-antitoxin system MqsA family antitoxin n=1 Tax=Marinobacter salexigens TaxID=1925763 RepID=UPI000C292128|nr:type II toxin-antitoxin system MqsA family antitoxin [Marinobacter salexigens]
MNGCKLCGSERVGALSDAQQIRYKSFRLEVDLAYSVCKACGREFVATEQIRKNDQAILAAKRHADGLLSPKEIRRAREVLGLTQHKAAELFGGGRNAFSKYERGEIAQSGARQVNPR